MTNAGLSGVVSRYAPGNMAAERSALVGTVPSAMDADDPLLRFAAFVRGGRVRPPRPARRPDRRGVRPARRRRCASSPSSTSSASDSSRRSRRSWPDCSAAACCGATPRTTATHATPTSTTCCTGASVCRSRSSIVAVEVGRRCGVRVDGVGLPGHFVVGDGTGERFADPFHGGRIYDRDGINSAWRRITRASAPLGPAMLLPTPPMAIVVRVLNNLRGDVRAARGRGPAADPGPSAQRGPRASATRSAPAAGGWPAGTDELRLDSRLDPPVK